RKWHWFGDDPVESFKLVVHGQGKALSAAETDQLRASNSALTVVSLRGRLHEQFEEAGFAIAKPTEVQISAEGEAREDGEFDLGWVIKDHTPAAVWRLSWRGSQ